MYWIKLTCCCMILSAVRITSAQNSYNPSAVTDIPFIQEYHVPHPVRYSSEAGEVRSIAVGEDGRIWISTPEGIFSKQPKDSTWQKLDAPDNDGPAYTILSVPGDAVWAGNWKGVFRLHTGTMTRIGSAEGPISVLCESAGTVYALGPGGMWLCKNNTAAKQSYPIARSVHAAIADHMGGIWVASDVGLYQITNKRVQHFMDTSLLVSAYVKGLAFDSEQRLWCGGLGGISILKKNKKTEMLRPSEGLSSIYVNCVKQAPDGGMWIGTDVGIVRYAPDGTHTLRFSRRWLLDDKVNDICFDAAGTAWIATAKGVSAIHQKQMTLADKEKYFYDVTMQRHVREPWIVGQCRLPNPEDVTRWEPEDDDNDGEYGGNYLAMESFRYAVTKDNDAKEKAKKAFGFLKMLREITGLDGFFARTVVPVSWGNNVHDPNRKYSRTELAEELVKEPRFKAVETRWHLSKDGKWLWKGDTSSDEWCGHIMGYFFYYELVADKKEKQEVARHVAKLVDHLIQHNFNMIDIDGMHTRWSVWSPDHLNRNPEWLPDKNQNSMELLTFLKLAYYMTGENKYQQHYLRLIQEEHYLENMDKILQQNPAWFIYFDVVLQMYLYPILLHCEKDPTLLKFYEDHMDRWMEQRMADKSPLINCFYNYARNKRIALPASVDFLRDTPLDLVNWGIDHRKREDIRIVHAPVLDEVQVSELPAASIRAAVRWDKNPWAAVNGQTHTEREPVFWLLPYWMGRYLKMIN